MKEISAISKVEPEIQLNWLVWWAECIVRQNAASNLRSAAGDLTWYQSLFTDFSKFLIS